VEIVAEQGETSRLNKGAALGQISLGQLQRLLSQKRHSFFLKFFKKKEILGSDLC
jgi:hypothetical protein